MKFRKRTDVCGKIDFEERKKRLSEYQNVYLSSIREKCGKDLWQFFGYDFFHDGKIKKVEYVCKGTNFKDLKLEIEGYNMHREDSNYSIASGFTCRFENVEFFSIEHAAEPDEYFFEPQELTYKYSEINTLVDEIEAANLKYDKIRKYMQLGEEAKCDKIMELRENRERIEEEKTKISEDASVEEPDDQEEDDEKTNFQSLIIYAFENETYISLVFEDLYVEPFESIAFELIKNDKRYNLPLRLD